MTPEERQAVLEYIERKYPRGGQWDLTLHWPNREGSDEKQEVLPDDAS